MFGLRYPIISAPMAYASGGDLAGAVSRAGALGMIGTGSRATAEWLDTEWQKVSGAGPVGIGFMTWSLDGNQAHRQLFDHALTLHPAAVLISFGDPRPYTPAIHAAGARAICQVQTVSDAVLAAEAGADLLVVQGNEAGGHTGQVGTMPLLAAVLKAVPNLPVAAAGGIGNGRTVAGVIAMGACGAMLGTRFLATPESIYRPEAKERILQATEADTVYTRIFDLVQGFGWPAQYAGRALRNSFTDRWHGHEAELQQQQPSLKAEYEAAKNRADYDTVVVYAGQVSGEIDKIEPAATLVSRIGAETEQALSEI